MFFVQLMSKLELFFVKILYYMNNLLFNEEVRFEVFVNIIIGEGERIYSVIIVFQEKGEVFDSKKFLFIKQK